MTNTAIHSSPDAVVENSYFAIVHQTDDHGNVSASLTVTDAFDDKDIASVLPHLKDALVVAAVRIE